MPDHIAVSLSGSERHNQMILFEIVICMDLLDAAPFRIAPMNRAA
jgi:hypothetical protein